MRSLVLAAALSALALAGVHAQTTDNTPAGETQTRGAPGDTGANATPDVDAEAPDDAGTKTDGTETEGTPAATATETVDPEEREAGLKMWADIHSVFSHPRCANCHVGDDNRPRWSGPSYGKTRVHGMNVVAGESRVGAEYMPCATCHGIQNIDLPHAAPGAPNWSLPPAEFAWFGKTSAQICAQIKDPARNGGRTLAEVAEHVDHDALLHWAWTPGPGREPAPFSRDELIDLIKAWDLTGAPCP